MAEKKDNLLKIIVEEYIQSASPIGSGLIAEKYLKDISSATVRNYMAQLEEEGLIFQPHTSAGRIPTLSGYQYYLDNFVGQGAEISARNKKELDNLKVKTDRDSIKNLAKKLAEISTGAILIGFGSSDVYYTGISNLFRQPEFSHPGLIYSMTDIIDHLDEVMAMVFNQIDKSVEVLIGEKNPFGENSSVVLAKYKSSKQDGLIGILGPNRMNYGENIGLIKYSQELLKN